MKRHLAVFTACTAFFLASHVRAADILFVDSESPDSSWQTLIESGGHTYTLFDTSLYSVNLNTQADIDYVNSFDLAVISGSNANYNAINAHGAKWGALPTPLINTAVYICTARFGSTSWRWLDGNGDVPGGGQNVTTFNVGDSADPIWNGVTLTPGSPDTVGSLFDLNTRIINTTGDSFLPGIVPLAINSSDSQRVAVAYAPPETFQPGGAAQYFIPSGTGGSGQAESLNGVGEQVFLNAIASLTGGVVVSVPLELGIAESPGTPGSYDFEWTGNAGKFYDLVSSTDLSTSPDTWAVWDGQDDIPASEAGTNTLTAIVSGDTKRFFAILEKDSPTPVE